VSTGTPSQPFTNLVFKSQSSSLNYIYEDGPKDLVLGASSNSYKNIKLEKGGNVKFTGGHKEYFIKKLEIINGTVNLPAADYWIEKLELENTRLMVDGVGTVRLFVKKEIEIERDSLINSPVHGEAGNPSQLLVFGFGKVEIGYKSTFSGLVYANNKVEVDNYSHFFGAISSSKIELENHSTVTYAANNLAAAYLDGLCNSPLSINILEPMTLITVASSPIALDGIINDADASLTVNGEPVAHNSGLFSVNVNLQQGLNNIVARAVNDGGQVTTSSISVYLDVTSPYITVESPKEGQVVYAPIIAVAGLVNDIVRGTISEKQATVMVNGVQALVKNRSYFAENVSLIVGANTITITASDEVGNTNTKSINIIYQPVSGQHIGLVSGQNQNAQIQSVLTKPLAVKLLDIKNQPIANKNVVFRVLQGDGMLAPGTSTEGQGTLVKTDSNGIATSIFKVGSRAGKGNHRVRAKAVGFEGEVIFYVSADPRPANKLSINSGNNQRAAISQSLPQPFVVVATDDGSNVIQGLEVEFKVTKGNGSFSDGSMIYRSLTDSDGRATAQFILGPESGRDFHRVTATIVGTGFNAGFTVTALVSGDPGNTSIKGVVLDNQDNVLPNVTIRIDGTNRQEVTDAQGQFVIGNVPVGPVHLLVDGSTTTLSGEWPTLSYNIVTVAGAVNELSSPIYLVKLNEETSTWVGQNDVEITVKDLPGFKLIVKDGSVTFPDGKKVGQLSITKVNANKIPMAPPNGMQPQFIITIQPVGTKFDPPATLILPNVDGHLPGAQVEMYSYDHDLEEFVTIGLGTVSPDGYKIQSNPGIGVIKAGWHCGSQPGGSGCTYNCRSCQKCDGDCNCVPDPTNKPRDLVDGDCHKSTCIGGEIDPFGDIDDTDEPKDLISGDCQGDTCVGGTSTYGDKDSDSPDDVLGDCQIGLCFNGFVDYQPDDFDIPEDEFGDCGYPICFDGEISSIPDDTDEPDINPNSDLCQAPFCLNGTIEYRYEAGVVQPDIVTEDCRTYQCALDGETGRILPKYDDYGEDRPKSVCLTCIDKNPAPDLSKDTVQCEGNACKHCQAGDCVEISEPLVLDETFTFPETIPLSMPAIDFLVFTTPGFGFQVETTLHSERGCCPEKNGEVVCSGDANVSLNAYVEDLGLAVPITRLGKVCEGVLRKTGIFGNQFVCEFDAKVGTSFSLLGDVQGQWSDCTGTGETVWSGSGYNERKYSLRLHAEVGYNIPGNWQDNVFVRYYSETGLFRGVRLALQANTGYSADFIIQDDNQSPSPRVTYTGTFDGVTTFFDSNIGFTIICDRLAELSPSCVPFPVNLPQQLLPEMGGRYYFDRINFGPFTMASTPLIDGIGQHVQDLSFLPSWRKCPQ